VGLWAADASLHGGLPLRAGCVDKLLADLPFGKQHGSVVGNESLYVKRTNNFERTAQAPVAKTPAVYFCVGCERVAVVSLSLV
jgi:hypothetical protein